MSDNAERSPAKEQLLWVTVFASNLIFLFWFGLLSEPRPGVFGGLLVIWAIGSIGVATFRSVRFALLTGGMFTALLQFVPLVHYYVLVVAMELVTKAGTADHPRALTELGCALTTVVAGLFLMVLAVVPGFLLCALSRFHD